MDSAVGCFHAQAQMRRLAVGAADAELLHFETAVVFDHRVEDLLHDVRVDQVAFGLDHFLEGRGACRIVHASITSRIAEQAV